MDAQQINNPSSDHGTEHCSQNIEISYSHIATLIDIDYPGKIVDAHKALKTLGGLKKLTKVSGRTVLVICDLDY